MSMFCYQCQEAGKGIGCTGMKGICGVTDDVIKLQDLSVYMLKGLSILTTKAREKGIENEEVNQFIYKTLFKTITNVNFSKDIL